MQSFPELPLASDTLEKMASKPAGKRTSQTVFVLQRVMAVPWCVTFSLSDTNAPSDKDQETGRPF